MTGDIQTSNKGPTPLLPVLRWWWVTLATIIAAVVTGGFVWWLLARVEQTPNPELAKAQLDAIRTALTVGIGAGGAFALWLATRRQRSTEMQLVENARIATENSRHQEYTAYTTEFDARERRITELYTKAVEQLGSDKAPVRLGGLYALERLGDDNPTHRQTITNVICAYLRMPFDPPGPLLRHIEDDVNDERSAQSTKEHEELQVRLTAQNILIDHLKIDSKNAKNWGSLSLNLRGATLTRFRLVDCRVGYADFAGALFTDAAHFGGTHFEDEVWFFECRFDGIAGFSKTKFSDRSIFTRTYFKDFVFMNNASFNEGIYMWGAKFSGTADFSACTFKGEVHFDDCTFSATLPEISEIRSRPDWPDSLVNLSDSQVVASGDDVERVWPPDWTAHLSPSGSGYIIFAPSTPD